MTPEAKALVRAAVTAGAGIALVLAGIALGANLWPRAVTVERRIVERNSAPPAGASLLPRLPDMIQAACAAVVAINPGEGRAPAPARAARKAGASHAAVRAPVGP